MPVPTIDSVTPGRGHSGGGTVLRITGSGFQLPAEPLAGAGPVPAPAPSVRVFLGGVEARRVRVASSSVLFVTTERRDPGVVDVEVRNVGPYGETIGAESVTLAGAFEYARPVFTASSDLERLIRVLHAELKRQVFSEVVVTAHVDWSDDPGAVLRGVTEAPLPCVFLAGPILRPNPVYRTNVRPRAEIAPNVLLEHRAPETDDLVFVCGAQADKFATLLSLTAALRDFRLRNPFVYLPREEGSEELVRYDLQWEGEITVDSSTDESNVRTCSGTLVVAGFDTLAAPGFENDQAVTASPDLIEDPEVSTTQGGR